MQHHHPLPTAAAPDLPRRQMLMALAAMGAGPALWPTTAAAQVAPVYGNFRGASLGDNANLNGAVAFPAGHAFNTDISRAVVDPASASILTSIGLTANLRPDFGSGTWDGGPIGIPYTVVSGTQAKVAIRFTAYGSESDPGPYPVPRTAPIEGGPNSAGDRHVIVIDRDNQRLYELYRAFLQADGSWNADCGAVFALDNMVIRPGAKPGWTSADAAGLPILPGLIRYEEASKGAGGIRHALRFTVSKTRKAYVPPASHWASSNISTALPPMGARFRLKAGFVIPSTFSNEAKAILTALKTYGMFVADHGSNYYLSGVPDARWNNSRLIAELKTVKGSHFDVVQMTGLVKG
ncbi:hypothetical protein HZU83_13950 [Sphaerotilus montanus]|jgi:hypothetical protein|uniref:Uncharacterized protein n=1 Tax=Sphaerotilus montanus TaxID=522889 RepID=A0A7Y9QXI9_9BURK|nr:hypothetical protein [Sphaerotilus montanus]NYG31067.1 hypothetical protein [Sphaerotilus montanus]NZD57794.1 hypothetical protein [Sphaerotilus montanus]